MEKLRNLGLYYPEFDAILKSLNSAHVSHKSKDFIKKAASLKKSAEALQQDGVKLPYMAELLDILNKMTSK